MTAIGALIRLALAGALALSAGCGGSETSAPVYRAGADSPPTVRTTVYLLADHGAAPAGVRRTIERTSPYARKALEALLAGPTTAERERGLMTGLPPGARLLSLSIEKRGSTSAVVHLTGLPPAQGGQGEEATVGMRLRVITQIARTLIGVSGIERVELMVDDKPWDLWTMAGGIVRTATDYERLGGLNGCDRC